MRLNKIDIKEFSLIKDISLEPGKLTIVHGSNESGKTVVLDSILEALFGICKRDGKNHFKGLEVYPENTGFSGVVEVEDNGSILRFPGETLLDKAAKIDNFDAVRNLLVVRDSELTFYEEEKGNWWKKLKERFAGYEKGLDKVVLGIREEVGLNIDGTWINNEELQLGKEVQELQEKKKKAESVSGEIEELTRINSQLIPILQKKKEAENKLSAVKDDKRKEIYNSADAMLTEFKVNEEKLKPTDSLNSSLLEEWRKTLREVGSIRETIRNREKEKDLILFHVNEKEEEVKDLRDIASAWENREAEIVPALEVKVTEIRLTYDKEQKVSQFIPLLIGGAIVLAGLVVFLLYLSTIKNSVSIRFSSIVPGIASFMLIAFWLRWRHITKALAKKKELLLNIFRSLPEEASSVDEVETWIAVGRRRSEQAKNTITSKLEDIEKDKDYLRQIDTITEHGEEKIRSLRDKMDQLREETGCATMDELETKLKERTEEILPEITKLKDSLFRLLGTSDVNQAEIKIEQLKQGEDIVEKSKDENVIRLQNELKDIQTEIDRLIFRAAEIEKRLSDAGFNSVENLWEVMSEVEEKLSHFIMEREAAETAIDTIKELLAGEDIFINSVLENGDNSAARYFYFITNGRYTTVYWKNGEIYTQTLTGRTFNFKQLSTGTRSQLLFSIRVALLERFFPDRSLPLFLDDPFITSDYSRIERLLELLFDLAKVGWQIVYFTADKDIPQLSRNIAERLGFPYGTDGLAIKEIPPIDIG
ncbi:MAG: AAA family ATPase [Planctomycetota bacterium]